MIYIDCTDVLTGRVDGGYFSVWPTIEKLNSITEVKLVVDGRHIDCVPEGFSYISVKKYFKFYFLPLIQEDDVFWAPLNYLYALNLQKVKVVSTIHDIRFYDLKETVPLLKRVVRNILLKRTLKLSHIIGCISEFTKNSIAKYVIDKNISIAHLEQNVIYNPFVEMDCNLVDEDVGFDKYFFTLSNGAPNKNTRLLLSSFKSYLDSGGDKALILAGLSEEKFKEYEFDTQGYPAIKLLGRISNNYKGNLYKKCCAFIWPSLYEGFGLPGLEAKYFDKPLICSDIEINRELFPNEMFFNSLSEDDLKKCIHDFEEDRINEPFPIDSFKLSAIVDKYLDVLR